MQEDLALRLRAGADILLQCPEHVRLNRNHALMDANLHRRADESNEAAAEIERLRLTPGEVEAIEAAIAYMAPVSNYNSTPRDTLLGLLKRLRQQ